MSIAKRYMSFAIDLYCIAGAARQGARGGQRGTSPRVPVHPPRRLQAGCPTSRRLAALGPRPRGQAGRLFHHQPGATGIYILHPSVMWRDVSPIRADHNSTPSLVPFSRTRDKSQTFAAYVTCTCEYGLHRVEGNRWASRNVNLVNLPPEMKSLTVRFATFPSLSASPGLQRRQAD
jgi:hypothetical protein